MARLLHVHLSVVLCSGQRPGWGICQPSAWAFQTMPHNVLDSPEKQPGAWKLSSQLPHLGSLSLWLSNLSLSLTLFVCSSFGISPPASNFPLLNHPPSPHFFVTHTSFFFYLILKPIPACLYLLSLTCFFFFYYYAYSFFFFAFL